MFDLTDRPLHWITVKWPGLAQDEGGESLLSSPTEHEIELRVELVDRDVAKDLFPNVFDEDRPQPEEVTVFKRTVKDWRKIVSGGRPVKFTEANIKRLLEVPMFGAAYVAAYIQALGGRVEIREKNSQGSPSNGRAADPEQTTKTPSQKTVDASE